jgi:hypothetical protein
MTIGYNPLRHSAAWPHAVDRHDPVRNRTYKDRIALLAMLRVRRGRAVSDCHFAVQLNHFIPGSLSYSVQLNHFIPGFPIIIGSCVCKGTSGCTPR